MCLPSVQNVNVELLCGSLDCCDLLVGRGLAEIVVRDMSFRTLPDEVAGLGFKLVDVALELEGKLRFLASSRI